VTTHLALLRAVNVGGRAAVAMADLRAVAEAAGLSGARTLLRSGNLLFESAGPGPAALERRLEAALARQLGLKTDVFVRTAAEWGEVVARNPLRDAARRDPAHLVVMVLRDAPGAPAVRALQAAVQGPELARAHGRELYVAYPAGIGRSRLTAAVIERALGTRGTARNWNTVTKLAALAGA
jgi:uncharacterized protein (DUF1697 family)